MDFDTYGGRRFLLTVFTGVATIILVAMKFIDGTVYASVTLGTVGVYIAANTHEKIKSSTTSTTTDTPASTITASPEGTTITTSPSSTTTSKPS